MREKGKFCCVLLFKETSTLIPSGPFRQCEKGWKWIKNLSRKARVKLSSHFISWNGCVILSPLTAEERTGHFGSWTLSSDDGGPLTWPLLPKLLLLLHLLPFLSGFTPQGDIHISPDWRQRSPGNSHFRLLRCLMNLTKQNRKRVNGTYKIKRDFLSFSSLFTTLNATQARNVGSCGQTLQLECIFGARISF